jgi:hypothetical protein
MAGPSGTQLASGAGLWAAQAGDAVRAVPAGLGVDQCTPHGGAAGFPCGAGRRSLRRAAGCGRYRSTSGIVMSRFMTGAISNPSACAARLHRQLREPVARSASCVAVNTMVMIFRRSGQRTGLCRGRRLRDPQRHDVSGGVRREPASPTAAGSTGRASAAEASASRPPTPSDASHPVGSPRLHASALV